MRARWMKVPGWTTKVKRTSWVKVEEDSGEAEVDHQAGVVEEEEEE